SSPPLLYFFFFFNDPDPPEIYTLSLHDALPIFGVRVAGQKVRFDEGAPFAAIRHAITGDSGWATASISREQSKTLFAGRTKESRSEEHTSELQSRGHLVCRLLLEKKKKKINNDE